MCPKPLRIPRVRSRLNGPCPKASIFLAVLAVLGLCGCGGGGGGNDGGGGGTGPVTPLPVVSVTINPPADTLLALGLGLQLSARATNSQGGVVSGATVTWSSSNNGVATVTSSGAVSSVGAGTTTITARSGTVSGILRLRILSADLAGIGTTFNEPFLGTLFGGLTAGKAASVQSRVNACLAAASAGNLSTLVQEFANLRAELSTSTDDADKPLLAVMLLFADFAERKMGL